MNILGQETRVLKNGRRNGEFTALVRDGEVDTDRLGHFKQLPVYHKGQTVVIKNFITFLRLIQSHRQRRCSSSTYGSQNSDGRRWPALQEFFDHLFSLF
jgi:hypothetical protein